MADIHIEELVIDGVRTPVRMGGARSDEAVLFVHGNPGSSEDYLGLLPDVADFAFALAPDMPGYGKAERPYDFDYTIEGYAAHLDALMKSQGIRKVHLVLHDFGGPWGLHWASEHLDQVASLTLLNVGVLAGYKWHKFARIWRTPVLGELFQMGGSRKMFHDLLNRENPKPFPPEFLDRMFDYQDWPMKRAVLKLYRATNNPGERSERVGALLKPAHIKALVLWGDGDSFLPVSMAEKQKDYFDAEVHVMHGCGHWPMIDDPEGVRSRVVPFLKAQVAGHT